MFAETELDVLVVGGGIVGACVAHDAALRGLRVGLVERGDFSGGATANCLKIVHGGLRYLQHLDVRRMRESIRERSYWLRAAPHLVDPLPVVVPTYRGGLPPRAALAIALAINELVSADRNRGLISERALPPSRLLTRHECLELIPELESADLTGGVLFHDAIMYSPERIALEVIVAAQSAGAVCANYVELEGVVVRNARVAEARLSNALTGERSQVRTRWLINAAGAWATDVMMRIGVRAAAAGAREPYSVALNFVTRQPARAAAFTIRGGAADPDRVVGSGGRQLFVVPWRGQTMFGTAHLPLDVSPADFQLHERHLESFIREIESARPHLRFTRDDVTVVHRGLLPGTATSNGSIRLLKHDRIRDHRADGIAGALSVISVKYTTARRVAEKVVDRIAGDVGRSTTRARVLPGGDFTSLRSLQLEAERRLAGELPADVIEHLVRIYGSRYERILDYRHTHEDWNARVTPGAPVIHAQLIHGVAVEHARTAEDLLYRRTEIGARGLLDDGALDRAGAAISLSRAGVSARPRQATPDV